MANLQRRVTRSNVGPPLKPRRASEPAAQPKVPPSPALQHLTQDEIQILQGVFKRQEVFEKTHESYAKRLERELTALEEQVKQQAAQRNTMAQCDLQLCRLCFQTKFADCIGRVCYDCHRRVCNRCGSVTFSKNKPNAKGRWRCNLCQKRREYACLTGEWFHGNGGQPSFNGTVFHRKLSDTLTGTESDWGYSGGSFSGSELPDKPTAMRDAKTDSELAVFGERLRDEYGCESPRASRRFVHRRTLSSSENADHGQDEEEEPYVDATQFMLERQKCRRERLEQQRRMNRRRGGRRMSAHGISIEGSGSNRDHSPDGRSQTSSMSENSGQTKHRTRHTSTSRSASGDRGAKGASAHPQHSHRRDSLKRREETKDGHKERQQSNEHPKKEQYSRRDTQKDPQHRRDHHQRHHQSGGRSRRHSAPKQRPNGTSQKAERRETEQPQGAQATSSDNSPKARSKKKSRRPGVDASCQVSEGDAPLAVLQRAALKASAVTSGDFSSRPFCRRHDGEILLGSNLVFPGSVAGQLEGPVLKVEDRGVYSLLRKEDKTRNEGSDLYRGEESERTSSNYNKKSDLPIEKTPNVRRISRQESISGYSPVGIVYLDNPPRGFDLDSRDHKPRPSTSYSHPPMERGLTVPPPPSSPPPGAGSLLAGKGPRPRIRSTGSEAKRGASMKPPHQNERRVSDHVLEQLRRADHAQERSPRGSSLDSCITISNGGDTALIKSPKRLQRSERLPSSGQLMPWSQIGTGARPAFNRQSSWSPFRVTLTRDSRDTSCRTAGLGMRVMGGKVTVDGTVGAFVVHVVNGGPADLNGIRVGDQILEWDGQNLEDATFEECRQCMDRPADSVQLLVVHTKMEFSNHEESSTESKKIPHWHPKSETRRSIDATQTQQTKSKKRMLPRTPVEVRWESRTISGYLKMRLHHDSKSEVLTVGILEARELPLRDRAEKDEPNAFVKVFLLPGRSHNGAMKTEPKAGTREPKWDAVFTFDNITNEALEEKSIEVTVWDSYPNKDSDFYGEILLDLANANLGDQETWYPLEDHDENSSPLPSPSPKIRARSATPSNAHRIADSTSGYGRQGWSSLPSLPATPAHDKMKKLLDKKPCDPHLESFYLSSEICESSPQLYRRRVSPVSPLLCTFDSSGDAKYIRSSTSSPEDIVHRVTMDTPSPNRRPTLKSRVLRQMSVVVDKVSAKLVDRRSHSVESSGRDEREDSLPVPAPSNERRHSHSGSTGFGDRRPKGAASPRRLATVTPPFNMELLTPSGHASHHSSLSSSGLIPSMTESETSDNPVYHSSPVSRVSKDNSDVLFALGPGQVQPRSSGEIIRLGDIQLGFIITKGQMEVDVTRAKELPMSMNGVPPDTYVKTCLMEGGRRIQRKKTKTVKSSTDPMYRQQIKYPACNIHGRHMQVKVKEKCSGFDKNPCLGEIVVKLDSLDLSRRNVGWYGLFQKGAVELGSTESLHM